MGLGKKVANVYQGVRTIVTGEVDEAQVVTKIYERINVIPASKRDSGTVIATHIELIQAVAAIEVQPSETITALKELIVSIATHKACTWNGQTACLCKIIRTILKSIISRIATKINVRRIQSKIQKYVVIRSTGHRDL